MRRRSFLKQSVSGAAVLAVANQGSAAETASTATSSPPNASGSLPRRAFGRHADQLSIIGLGGIVVMGVDQPEANRCVAEAVERGVNYFDVAPSYGGGEAEEKLGPALEPYRKDAFLACKTAERNRAAAEAEFELSLKRLRTDHFNLFQLHAITDVAKDVETVFAKDGVMDMLVARQKAGQIRYLGFSAHSEAAARAAMDRFDFDSILFPINFATFYKEDFGPAILREAERRGMARLALKAMAKQQWAEGDPKKSTFGRCWYEPLSDPAQAELGLRWTLTRPITAAIPPGNAALFRMALDIAARYTPVTEKEEQQLQTYAKSLTPIFAKA